MKSKNLDDSLRECKTFNDYQSLSGSCMELANDVRQKGDLMSISSAYHFMAMSYRAKWEGCIAFPEVVAGKTRDGMLLVNYFKKMEQECLAKSDTAYQTWVDS